jgi:phosphate acetyltransferase
VSDPRRLLLVPVGHGVGLTSIAMGLVRALDQAGARVSYVKPVGQRGSFPGGVDPSTELIRLTTVLDPPQPISPDDAEHRLSTGDEQVLLEAVVGRVQDAGRGAELLVIEGLVPSSEVVYSTRMNLDVASAVDARVVFVGRVTEDGAEDLAERVAILANLFRTAGATVEGCVVNRLPVDPADAPKADWRLGVGIPAPRSPITDDLADPYRRALAAVQLSLKGLVREDHSLGAPRVFDISQELGAHPLEPGEMRARRVSNAIVGAMTAPNFLKHLTPGTLVVTPGDRSDIVMAVCLAELAGMHPAGIVLTGGLPLPDAVLHLARPALDHGLPVLEVDLTSAHAIDRVLKAGVHCPIDDRVRAQRTAEHVARDLDPEWITQLCARVEAGEYRLSPPAFRHRLIERSRAANKRIVLPEGREPRTIAAAAVAHGRGIARCVLLGEPDEIRAAARRLAIELPSGVELIRPKDVAERYVAPMCELRKSKNLLPQMARDQLTSRVMLGTMMLALGEVDGLVSGAEHTTADTIRPALQLVRTAKGSKLVSSLFFMCLPDQVRVYADCAVNPDPTAEQLAEIAIQSADSAKAFGIPPRVAMLSYSTGASGTGGDVEKVRLATELARARRPDLAIDGPLQYDAALVADVASSKAPGSDVAGRATVLIFPDLDAGNMTYKAVQRSAHVVSIGPMLQGLARPVNDLSRGCLVEDIIYTIALTAIQADSAS